MKSSKFLNKTPTIMGLTPPELAILVGFVSLGSMLFPSRPILIGMIALIGIIILLTVKYVFGVGETARFFMAVFNKKKITRPGAFEAFRILNEFSEAIYDEEDSILTRLRDILRELPEGLQIRFHFVRLELDLKNQFQEKSTFIELTKMRRSEYLNDQFFENKVYISWSSNRAKNQCERILRDLGLNYNLVNLELPIQDGFVSSNVIHNEAGAQFSFELRDLPLEFSLRDVSAFLRLDSECVYSIGFYKSGSRREIQKLSLRSGSLASFSQGGAASRMEAGLSRESANDTLESLIRGEDSVFSVQSIISYKKKERFFEFPQIKFRESLKKLGHLKSEELLKLHLGKKDKLLEHKLTGMELAALLPLHFTMSAPREFPNFLTPERELLHFSGFADNLPNGNAVLFGPSGKGKSMMLANLFAYIMEETNSEIIILDNGRGFENFVRAYGGKTFEMTSEAVPVGLNLCQILSGFDKNFRAECLTDFTRFLINSRGEINNLILSRMKRLATLNFPKNLNHWQKMLNENQCEEIAEQILPFVHGEIYGDHFDAPISADLNSRILYFTGPMISPGQNNPLIIPYFFVVNLLVASRASFSDKHPPAIVCWDEAAWLMNHAPNVVSSMWNCMRKTGNSVIASAQHPGQITVHSSGRDILENSPTRWVLGLSEGISELDNIMEINSSEKRALGVRRPGDFFLVGREAQKYWVSFLQSPLHYALFTTSKKERVEIEKLINEENEGTAQQKVIQACTRWSLSKVKAGMLTVLLILGFIRPASAFWGIGDTSDPILLGILQQSTQQVAALIQQIELARRHYYEFQSVYKDARKVLNDLKTATEVLTSNKREYSGAREKLEAVKMIMRSADSMKNLPDEIQRKINSIGEAVVYQDKQSQMAEVFRGFGVEISDQARGASVGVAEKLTAQGIGLQLQTLADISRGQAEILRLAAIDEARKVKAEAGEQMLQGQLADLRNLNPGQTIRRPY